MYASLTVVTHPARRLLPALLRARRDAYKVDQAERRHGTEFFVRFRPARSDGTFEGKDPLAGVPMPAEAARS